MMQKPRTWQGVDSGSKVGIKQSVLRGGPGIDFSLLTTFLFTFQFCQLCEGALSRSNWLQRADDISLQIAACILDPLLRAVNESASRLPTCDMAVYLLNCVYQMQSTLSLYEFMDERLERLQVMVFSDKFV